MNRTSWLPSISYYCAVLCTHSLIAFALWGLLGHVKLLMYLLAQHPPCMRESKIYLIDSLIEKQPSAKKQNVTRVCIE